MKKSLSEMEVTAGVEVLVLLTIFGFTILVLVPSAIFGDGEYGKR